MSRKTERSSSHVGDPATAVDVVSIAEAGPLPGAEPRQDEDDSPDALGLYLESIRRYSLRTREDEAELARRMHAGDQDALDALVCANLRFVVSVARRYQYTGMPLVDLIAEGNLGLTRAALKFDETKGTKFISYAVWWIRQAILQALAEQSRIVRVPLNRAGTLHRIGKRANALLQELGREPTHEEIADGMDISEEEVDRALTLVRPTLSFEAPIADGANGCLADLVPDERAASPDQQLMDEARRESLRAAFALLRPREARVLHLYFGLGGDEPLTLEEIGALLGVTRERARQLKANALGRLRTAMRARELASWAGA